MTGKHTVATDPESRAAKLFAQGKYRAAINIAQKAVWKRQNATGELASIGARSFLRLAEPESALELMEQAQEARVLDAPALTFLSELLRNDGRYDEAKAAAEAALKLDKTCHRALLQKGIALSRLGKYKKAVEVLSEYISLVPEDPEGYYARGCAGVDEKARETDFDRVFQLNVDFPDLRADLGEGFLRAREFEKAAENFESAARGYRERGDQESVERYHSEARDLRKSIVKRQFPALAVAVQEQIVLLTRCGIVLTSESAARKALDHEEWKSPGGRSLTLTDVISYLCEEKLVANFKMLTADDLLEPWSYLPLAGALVELAGSDLLIDDIYEEDDESSDTPYFVFEAGGKRHRFSMDPATVELLENIPKIFRKFSSYLDQTRGAKKFVLIESGDYMLGLVDKHQAQSLKRFASGVTVL